ncbi:anti-sigma factor domain-containing protein [Loktanella salsilacus]|uniref:anti-sigma factor n=1 Tax=Loktanella salsilacus TaxID=195913 RepID=UPI003734D727
MTDRTQEITALADEYVLGLLSESEDILFEALLGHDPALANRVGALRDTMLPLDLSAPQVPLAPGFAARVRRALPAATGAAPRKAANLTSAPKAWLPGLIAASVVGAAIGFGGAALRPAPLPTVVAVLVDDNGVPQAVIDDYGNDTASVRFVADITVPPDRSLQVWTLPSAEMGPTSLGTLNAASAAALRFADLPDPGAQQLYEVTLEPLGGSPTGRPTGPIIGKGFAASQT